MQRTLEEFSPYVYERVDTVERLCSVGDAFFWDSHTTNWHNLEIFVFYKTFIKVTTDHSKIILAGTY